MTTTRTTSANAGPAGPWGRGVNAEMIFNYATPVSVALQVFEHKYTQHSELTLPILDSPAEASWVAESAEIPLTDPDVDEVVVRPRKVAVLSGFSREALRDDETGTFAAASTTAHGLAAKIDAALFSTLPTPAPSGLTGITPNEIDDDPATSLDGYLAAAAHAESLGTVVGSFVLASDDWKALSKLRKGKDSNEPLLSEVTGKPRRQIAGASVFVSEHVPAGTAWALPRDAGLIVVREDVDLTVDGSRYLEYDRIAIRAIMRCAFAFVRPSTISKIEVAS